MRKITPLVVSGSQAIGKTAFASRLVREHPNMFQFAGSKIQQNEISKTQKIPVFSTSELELAGNLKESYGSVNSLYIMPPNIQSFRHKLEASREHSQVSVDSTVAKVQQQVNTAINSDLIDTQDFIVHHTDFEKSYSQFKARVFSYYKN